MNEFPIDDASKLSRGYVLSRSYQLYAEHFWRYFRIALIPALLTYLFNYAQPSFNRSLARIVLRSPAKLTLPYLAMAGWATSLVYWITSMFFFAAIAATFRQNAESDQMAVADSYSLPRKRLWALVKIALIVSTLFYIGRILAGLAVFGLLEAFRLGRNFWTAAAGIGAMLVLLCALLSKFGLAVPVLMEDSSISATQAMRKSLKATEGWEIFFMLFLIKSAVVGYFAYWITNYALNWTWDHWALNAAAYSWVARTIYICLGAALESPLFIVFCVLYEKLKTEPEKTAFVTTV